LQGLAAQSGLAIANARLFRSVNTQREQLRALNARLVEAQEAERRQVARELHDQIGQVLTAVSADLQALEPSPDPAVHAERLEASLRLVDEALRQVRDLSLDLRPALLDDLGLGAALEWYLERQAQRSQFRAELVVEPPELRLPPELETTLFRLAQIALTNVVRHAQAKQVRVEVCQQNGHVNLVVRDDGIGFDVPAALDRASRGDTLGLVSLQERAQLAGGEVEILSTPGQGTEIRARFPLE
jgi:signal transduction histidine kinase